MNGLTFDALGLVVVAGTGLLAVSSFGSAPVRTLPVVVRAASLLALFGCVIARDRGDGWLAAVAFVAVAAEVIVAVADRVAWPPVAVAGLGGVAAVAASAFDGDVAAGLAVAGAGAVVVAAVVTARVGVVAVPAVVLVAAEHLAAGRVADGAVDRVGLGVAVLGPVVALALRRTFPSGPGAGEDSSFAWPGARPALAAVAVALIVLAQDDPALHAAGLLLAGGTVLATASRHRLGLVALAPGAAATVEAAGVADHPVHAVAAVSVLVVVAAAMAEPSRRPAAGGEPQRRVPTAGLTLDVGLHWPVPLALIFAVVPLWGWSGAEVGIGYGPAVATAAATAGIVGILAFGRLRRAGAASSVDPTPR